MSDTPGIDALAQVSIILRALGTVLEPRALEFLLEPRKMGIKLLLVIQIVRDDAKYVGERE
jgi:hypothetical protein